MRRAFAALALAACAPPAPPPAAVTLPLPTVPATATSAEARDTKPSLDEGDFSSDRGMVHLTAEPDGTLAGTFSGGVITCRAKGEQLSCRWYDRSGEGRATLRRTPEGRLEGTWGNGASDADGGGWTLAPIPRASPLDGVWDTNWGAATLTTSARGVHVDYGEGTMDCTQRDRTLACAWTEGGAGGNAELTIESTRVLRGRWGSGASSTDGGPWVFVRR